MTDRPRLLIEDWLPVRELGIESRREAAPIPGQFPKLKTLHVWWARRPIVVSAAAVLCGLLPTWSQELAERFPNSEWLKTEESYHRWLLRLVGILGDPIAAKRRADAAKSAGRRLEDNPYTYRPAFKYTASREEIDLLHQILRHTWGESYLLADPTAGGGSIPWVSARYGLRTFANDLNEIAYAILVASVQTPAQFGPSLYFDIKKWGQRLVESVSKRLRPYFPDYDNEVAANYLFAHAVRCPRDKQLVPLTPDWWLRRDKLRAAVRILPPQNDGAPETPQFEVAIGEDIDFDPSKGTVRGGDAVCPYDHLPIDGDYIKCEARNGRMTQVLYAVVTRRKKIRSFRAPAKTDLDTLNAAAQELSKLIPSWQEADVLPVEEIGSVSNYDRGHRLYGITHWRDLFTPRQLLAHGVFVEEFQRLIPMVHEELGIERGNAVLHELALMQGKALNYNALQTSWDVSRQKTRSVFEKHNFSFKWTFVEFPAVGELFPWCLEQLLDAYDEISKLLRDTGLDPLRRSQQEINREVTVTCSNAADLAGVSDRSVTHLCMDPPYYDNVMYAELADFFYVWEKRTLGKVSPENFTDELTDKENEAIANPARFAAMGTRKKELADADYEAKMTAIFAECERVLRDDGVLTVMFTHKRAEAWDVLGMGLLQAGFIIETSWPVNTESEQSSHQAKKNAAASTIMLVCRKRLETGAAQQVFFEDIESEVRQEARTALERFIDAGLSGVDLLLSTYGPALSVISRHWPVYSSTATEDGAAQLLRPEEALNAARSEVVRLQRGRLIGHPANLDTLTDFTLIAWDTFRAPEFPYDEARRLALAVGGLDVAELEQAKILVAKSGTVRLLAPKERVRRGEGGQPGVRPTAERFTAVIDAVHTIMYVAELDGLPVAKTMMDRLELTRDPSFLACVQGLINAVPRTKVKGDWVLPEAAILDRLVGAYLPDISVPSDEPEPAPRYMQGELPSWAAE